MADLRVWAPATTRMRTRVVTPTGTHDLPMIGTDAPGWYRIDPAVLTTALGELGHTDPECLRYGFLIDDEERALPDPRSVRLPDGVHGLSAFHVVDPSIWHDAQWTGRDIRGAVLYELHIGTFTPEGTSTRPSGTSTTWWSSASMRWRSCRSTPSTVSTTGATTRRLVCGARTYGGPDAFARFVDAVTSGGWPWSSTSSTTTSGRRAITSRFRPYLGAGSTGWVRR